MHLQVNKYISRLAKYLTYITVVFVCSITIKGLEPTYVSPYYFGPNAFPIPDIVDKTSPTLNFELSSNYFYGMRGDKTWDATLKAIVPLWSDRVNLCVWLPVMEWYRHSDAYLSSCNVAPPYSGSARKGYLTGDVYVTTDMLILQERGKYRPDILLRAGLKTASGGGSTIARYYDCPGYFFDAAFAKSFVLSAAHSIKLRLSIASGFLCWQTDKDRQNDAVMFGVKIKFDWKKFSLSEAFCGYSGWEHLATQSKEMARDFPMSFKTRATYSINDKWEVFGLYEHGLDDYPYRHFGLGAAYKINILSSKGKRCCQHF